MPPSSKSPAPHPPWLLYGANGYTGTLIAEEAVRRGMRPILAGRRAALIQPLAERLGLEHRVFPLGDAGALNRATGEVAAVLLAAGPFYKTSGWVRAACIAQGKHYLDITGEFSVFEACQAQGAAAAQAGTVLLPGVGFDVVPSDCLAAALHTALPNATHLQLALHLQGGVSPGTTKTMLEGAMLGAGGMVREQGQLVAVPPAHKTRTVPFADRTRFCATFPWGDISTAYVSTGIPNIEVYFSSRPSQVRLLRLQRYLAPLLRLPPLLRLGHTLIDRLVPGPSEAARLRARSFLWGQVRNAAGQQVEGTLETLSGYQLTMLTAVACMQRVLQGGIAPGMQTPSRAFGAGFIQEFPDTVLRVPRNLETAVQRSVPG